ncbi:MAG: hypothetical protein LBR47_03275 [Spirochaetaceae bacterium]|nr:hypothetical protein [Spirochaetaceae bacterium]
MEYPHLSFSSDPEIERYFELRKAGKVTEAFAVYNTYLRPRYPDEQQRILLLKAYRSRDPRYKQLLISGVLAQANRTVEQIKHTIMVLTDTVEKLDMNDAYSIIRTFDRISASLSEDKYQAIVIAERLAAYAKMLEFRTDGMENVVKLLRMYITNTLDTVNTFKKERAEERLKKNAQTRQKNTISDFSSIQISAQDVAAIRIAPSISRTEDKVIAYCIKYWNRTSDEAFEKVVYLYSRKYTTSHFSIYQAIKNGKQAGHRDEEILNSVLSIVSSGYYYNIRGDLYLQVIWKRLKERFITPPSGQKPGQPAPSVRKVSADAGKVPVWDGEKQPVRPGTAKTPGKAAIPSDKKELPAAQAPLQTVSPEKTQAPGKRNSVKLSPAKTAPSFVEKTVSEEASPGRPIYHPVQPSGDRKIPASAGKSAVRTISVSDYIKRLSGLSYDLYKDLFFAQIRPAIRTVLDKSRAKKSLFDSSHDEAEEAVFSFFRDNYTNPYMNWDGSPERSKLHGLGYEVPSIFPIIDIWYKKKQI